MDSDDEVTVLQRLDAMDSHLADNLRTFVVADRLPDDWLSYEDVATPLRLSGGTLVLQIEPSGGYATRWYRLGDDDRFYERFPEDSQGRAVVPAQVWASIQVPANAMSIVPVEATPFEEDHDA